MKTPPELEKIFKGCANHRRIRVLLHVERHPGMSLSDIVEELGGDFKAVAEHARKLSLAGLVSKKKVGSEVQHTLTSRGRSILSFCRIVL
jgi:DNA-binding MarR family transcriptional regulator